MNFHSKYAFAIGYATAAHAGQVRKYTGEAYVEHTIAVAKAVEVKARHDSLSLDAIEWMVTAAILHDVLEDTAITYTALLHAFGGVVANVVLELTDVYTPEAFPNLNRAIRKDLEAKRLGGVSSFAKRVKHEDIAENTASIVEHDPSFAKMYLKEKEAVLEAIK